MLTSCSSAPVVDAGDVEQEISAQLEDQVGVAPDDVSCPEDLTGEVGEHLRCTITAGDDELGVDVEVTGVDGEDVDYAFEVDQEVQ